MKRLLLMLLALLSPALLLAGCEKAAPAPEIVYVTVTPEPTPEPVPEAAEVPGFPMEEGGFPGGLDDDGRGPGEDGFNDPEIYGTEANEPGGMSGLTPVDFIPLDSGKQYEANIFLSNFAEQGINIYLYDQDMSQILPSLIGFAHIWYKINDSSAISYGTLDGETYETIPLERIASVIKRYISLTVTEETVEKYYEPQEHSFFQDGVFFFDTADGESYNRIAVADSLSLLEDGRYCLTFTEYEVDIETYFDVGIPRSYYELNPTEASRHPSLTRLADGYAIVIPYSYNGRSTYQLVEYTTW